MGTRYGPIEYREKDHYDIDQKLLSVDHCESMSYFDDFNHTPHPIFTSNSKD